MEQGVLAGIESLSDRLLETENMGKGEKEKKRKTILPFGRYDSGEGAGDIAGETSVDRTL